MAVKRNGKGQFEPGVSGNPGGRPKDEAGLRALCREYTELAVKLLVAVMTNGGAQLAVRVTAACAILDRGWGRPAQSLELSSDPERPLFPVDPMSDLERARRILFVLDKPLRKKPTGANMAKGKH